jgi:molybdopterin converting factor small subunit
MSLKISIFGHLTEITGPSLECSGIQDTEQLKYYLYRQFPNLQHKSFAIAVDKKVILSNTLLNDHSEIALLPPFSGG